MSGHLLKTFRGTELHKPRARMSDYTETFGVVKRYLKENNGEMQHG